MRPVVTIGIWIPWMALQAFSSGNRLNVPLAVTLTPLQPPSSWPYQRSCAFSIPQPEPIGVIRLPYSLSVQVVGSFTKEAPGQASVDECIHPMLCPTSWTRTVQPVLALNHASDCGLLLLPSEPMPLQAHADTFEPKYHM